ncbi:hypothetical protein ACFZAM_31710 [Streptomyces sp. NPDC008079]|uniref:hypothetical protein n=1 Tax=Streptomyces sp. NPDC008079 TaxID=3364806 RepID=UPI0036E45631
MHSAEDGAAAPQKKQRREPFSSEEIAEILGEYAAEPKVSKIAARHRSTPPTIKRLLVRNGVKGVGRRTWSDEEIAAIVTAYKTRSTVQIAEEYGTSYDTVRRLLRDNGVRLRNFKEASAIVMRYASDGDLQGLADDLGVEAGALYVLMVKHGFLPETP